MQQGDPLGPQLFCLVIHKLVSQLGCKLCLFYLEDGTLGSNPEQVLQDLRLVEQGGKELGLSLNHGKSEVITNDPTTTDTYAPSHVFLWPPERRGRGSES